MSAPIGVLTNMGSIRGTRQLGLTSRKLQNSMAKLSSGLRVRSAADDAAGMAVATNFMAQTRSQVQAQRNANDAVALLQTAESAFGTIADIMIRMRELGVQAANDTYTDTDRAYLDTEFQQLVSEVDRISAVAEFNGITLLDTAQTLTFQVGIMNTGNDQITVGLQQVNSTFLKVNGGTLATAGDAQNIIDAVDEGLQALSTERSVLGATINQLTWASDSVGVAHENLTQALSQIRDVDITTESATYTGQNILMQSGVSMLAQANQLPNLALQLLG